MAHNKKDCPHKPDIDAKAKDARAHLQKFKDAHSDFVSDIDLQIVDDDLAAIAMDNHNV